jgi:hypothetical protein
MMPGSLLTLLTPPTFQTFLHVLYGYVLPITVHCAWSTLVLLDLAQAGLPRRRALTWCAIAFLVPFAGAAAYLIREQGALSATTRLAVVTFGGVIIALAYGVSYALIG